MEYLNRPYKLHDFIPRVGPRSLGLGLSRHAWVRFNCLQTGIGRFWSSMHNWGLAPSYNCECGAHEQTSDHIISASYPTYRAPKGHRSLSLLDDETGCWLKKHYCYHLMKQKQPDNPR